jgi:hypothetical protein
MPIKDQKPSHSSKACSDCCCAEPSLGACDGRIACTGYGTKSSCPPMIVFTVIECARVALAACSISLTAETV